MTFCTKKQSTCTQVERVSLLLPELFFFNFSTFDSYTSIILLEKPTLDTFEIYLFNKLPDQVIRKSYSLNKLSSVETLDYCDSVNIYSYSGDQKYTLIEKIKKEDGSETNYLYISPDYKDTLYSGTSIFNGCNVLYINTIEYYYESNIRKQYKRHLSYCVDYKTGLLNGKSNENGFDKLFFYNKDYFVDSITHEKRTFIVRYE